MNWGEWFNHYFLNIDAIIALSILAIAIYFILTQKRKKCKFMGLNNNHVSANLKKIRKKKNEPKKIPKKLNKHEEECRRIFQELYGKNFKSVRPSWLRNPVTSKNLELDGFCPSIDTILGTGLAFEYDGEQHSKFNKHFHRGGHDEFIYQVKKDSWKDLKCKERGVSLVRIPHFVAFQDLKRYIISELQRQKIEIPSMNRGLFKDSIYS